MAKRKVAVFDIDGTVFRSSLLIELTEELIARDEFKPGIRRLYAKAHKDWLDRKGSYDKYIGAVVVAFDTKIRGVPEDKLLLAVENVIAVHQHRVYRYTRDLIKDLKRKGYFMLAISHSPKYVVDGFCKKMGFDKVYGRILELDKNKKFTGKMFYTDIIDDKSKILKRAVERNNLTMKGSVGVGDTESDIPILRLVETPICFNPNKKLYNVAKRNHWQVVVERKNVVYDIL